MLPHVVRVAFQGQPKGPVPEVRRGGILASIIMADIFGPRTELGKTGKNQVLTTQCFFG